MFWNDPQYQVKKLYEEHCQSCHELDGFGGGDQEEDPAEAVRAEARRALREQ